MVFQTLNRLKWTGRLESCTVVIRHRGAPGDRNAISGRDISEVRKSHFIVQGEYRETLIPNHRVLEITAGSGTVWKRIRPRG